MSGTQAWHPRAWAASDRRVAKRARAFDMELHYHSRTRRSTRPRSRRALPCRVSRRCCRSAISFRSTAPRRPRRAVLINAKMHRAPARWRHHREFGARRHHRRRCADCGSQVRQARGRRASTCSRASPRSIRAIANSTMCSFCRISAARRSKPVSAWGMRAVDNLDAFLRRPAAARSPHLTAGVLPAKAFCFGIKRARFFNCKLEVHHGTDRQASCGTRNHAARGRPSPSPIMSAG